MEIAPGFRGPSNHDPHISRLRTQTWFCTPLSCDLEPDITKPTPRNIFASSEMAPDPSSGLDSGLVINQGFCGPSNHQRDQTTIQNSKLQMQPQAVPVSVFSILTNPTSRKTVASSDLAPDPPYNLDSGGVIA